MQSRCVKNRDIWFPESEQLIVQLIHSEGHLKIEQSFKSCGRVLVHQFSTEINYRCIFLCIAFVIPIGSLYVGAAISNDDRSLIDTIRLARQSTVASTSSGNGEGTFIETDDESPGWAKPSGRIGPIKVQFAFSGRNNIFWETDIATKKMFYSSLKKDGISTRYATNSGRPPWVMISRIGGESLHNPLMEVQQDDWSTAEFARISFNSFDEDEHFIFDVTCGLPSAKLSRNNGLITLSFTIGSQASRQLTTGSMTFDLTLGGMITSLAYQDRVRGTDGKMLTTKRVEANEWQSTDHGVLPKSRTVTAITSKDGAIVSTDTLRITIDKINIGPIDPAELDIKNLEIPIGTPVLDKVAGVQYQYVRDTGVRTGGLPVNATPDLPIDLLRDPANPEGPSVTGNGTGETPNPSALSVADAPAANTYFGWALSAVSLTVLITLFGAFRIFWKRQ